MTQLRAQRDRFAKEHEDQIEKAAKAGWFSKGSLYVTLGVLAIMAAVGTGGSISGSKGVLAWVSGQFFGQFLLGVAGVGFAAYALWRFVQAAVNPEQHKSKKRMVIKRIGWAMSGVVHVSLSVAAFQMLGGGSSGQGKKVWIDQALSESWGPFLVGALGVFVIGVGLYQFKKAAELGFMDDVEVARMSPKETKLLRAVGRAGHAARGVIFPIIGYFLLQAAIQSNAGQAKGVGGALHTIAEAGWFWLALVAAGLVAYGVMNLLYARYRGVDV